MGQMFIAAEVKSLIKDYEHLFGFETRSFGETKVVIENRYFKIIFLDNRYDLDVFISDSGEANKVHLESLVEFLCPDFVFPGPRYSGGFNFDVLIRGCLKDVLMTGKLNWTEVLTHERYKYAVREYIVTNYPPGHELIYRMNSGHHWLKRVQAYFDEHGIKIST